MHFQRQHQILLSITALAASAAAGFAGEIESKRTNRAGMRDVVSHEALTLALRQSQQKDPMKELAARSGESTIDPVKENRPRDLIKNSDILCFRGAATLVPKRAVLHIPDYHKNRLGIQPGAKIQSFSEFFAVNRGWIQTVEVSREQAEGKQPLAEAKVEMIAKSSRIMIATFRGGPISVLPLQEPAEDENANQPK